MDAGDPPPKPPASRPETGLSLLGSRPSEGVPIPNLDLAQRYFDGWNAHDPAAIAATFASSGTYTDPNVSNLDAEATGAYAVSLVAAFPDLRFDLVTTALTDAGSVAAEWVMRGTNTGSFNGLPPTGREISLPGADLITFTDDGIATVNGYFDGAKVARDLDLDVIVQPKSLGPWRFGISSRAVKRDDVEPGAFSMTVLTVRSDEEFEDTRVRTREIVGQLLDAPGFLSFTGVTVGRRMYTITAWETPEAARQVRSNPAHRAAVGRFFGPEVASGGYTGIWAPHQINGTLVRCDCGAMRRAAAGTCTCGAELPAATVW